MASAIEEPEFDVLATLGAVEFRRYGPTLQAVTPMTSSGSSFRRLAGFIFGGNDRKESIAMTAPVQENLTGDDQQMAFFMPTPYSLGTLPQPNEADVQLREVPSRLVAVLAFSGWATSSRVDKHQRLLDRRLAEAGVGVRGEWLLNQYDPPWALPFLRRNEIWVEVDGLPRDATGAGSQGAVR